MALADWGKGHRFAGSGDRAAIGNLVFDALRRRRSLAAQMGERHAARPGAGRRAAGARACRRTAVDRQRRRLAARARAAERGRAGRPGAARFPPMRPPAVRGDFPGLARAVLRARVRRARPPRRAPRSRAGRRSTCASTRSRPTATKVLKALAALRARADALVAAGRAPAGPRRRRPAAQRRGRGRPRQRLVRGAGRRARRSRR